MNVKQLVTALILLVTVVGFSNFTVLNDGTRDDALKAYNEGSKLANEDPEKAIELLEKAVSIAEKLDSNGTDILKKATKKLPGLYYNVASNIAKQKNYAGAIEAYGKALEVAEKYESKRTIKACNKMLPKMHFANGQTQLKAKNYDGAIASYDEALKMKPSYTKAMYAKALATKGKGDIDGAVALFEEVITKSEEAKDSRTGKKAKKAIYNTLRVQGKKLNKAKNYSSAIETLNKALEYAPEGKGETDADKQADLNKKLAGVYFELGNAYWGKKNKGEACKAYRKAAYGKYKVNADYQLKNVVKCP
jgi:tetratricopeptide (TPR) repeat protein